MLLSRFGTTAGQATIPPPAFVSAATSTDGLTVTVTFSKAMADPSGKHAQFTVLVNGAGDTVTAAALNATTTKIDLIVTTAITNGQTVTVAYTAGTVISADTGILASFAAQTATNNVPSPYQQWTAYPQTPILTSTGYIYQVIRKRTSDNAFFLYASKNAEWGTINKTPVDVYQWYYNGSAWVSQYHDAFSLTLDPGTMQQANYDVTVTGIGGIYFAKTTP